MKKLILIIFLVLMLTACAGKDTAAPLMNTVPPPASNPVAPTATLLSETQIEQAEAWEKWSNGAHAESDEVLTCEACHQIQNGIADEALVWQNPETGQYEPVNDGSALCIKCHTNYESGQGAHTEMTCLDCHDQHGATASCYDCHKQIEEDVKLRALATPFDGHPGGMSVDCEGSGCHSMATQVAQLPFSIHGAAHANVACEACHDGGGLAVGPSEDGSGWMPWLEIAANGEPILMPFRSHNLQYEVDCARCHYEQNPWGLGLVE